ncbi:MAG: mechanosensitive ion channel family protein [Xenococcaceae cyanobacterium]
MKLKKKLLIGIVIGILAFNLSFILPVKAQLPFLPQINLRTFNLNQNPDNIIASACVRLDGNCLFRITDRQVSLPLRISQTEQRIEDIRDIYLRNPNAKLDTRTQKEGNFQNIYISVGDREMLVLSLTDRDVNYGGIQLNYQAEQKAEQIKAGLEKAKLERQQPYLINQAKIAASILVVSILSNFLLSRWQKRYQQAKQNLSIETNSVSLPVSTQQEKKHSFSVKEVQLRIFQLLKIGIWLGALLLILGLFPYTRATQLWTITVLRIPLRLFIIAWATYILIRLSYALIAKLNSTFTNTYVLSREANRRIQLRVTTISYLLRGIVATIWSSVGILAALMVIGIDVAPLLAGAGILGLAFSFASQNLIKDALNGFFIIIEDQYAVGDVITVGAVSGLVERLNLRITQLRDAEGRLITIPNSSIQTVANHSNGWSRSDIKIPIAYSSDIDKAIKIIQEVGEIISQEAIWAENILEVPQVLGVEDFADRGLVIRIWIKTEPLKQWEVSREFRLRVKKALEAASIPLPIPQQQIWINRSSE